MFLLENKGNLSALSNEVFKRITNNYDTKGKIGENSKIIVIKNDLEQVFRLMNNREVLMGVLRYGQDDLFLLKDNYDGIKIVELNEYEYLTNDISWRDRPNLQSTIKSVSGMKTFVSNLSSFITNEINKNNKKKITKKDVIAKINFQLIYQDETRKSVSGERITNRGKFLGTTNKKTYDHKKVHGSVYDSRDKDYYKASLKERLKEFILEKLPKYDNPEELPKKLDFLRKDTQFKLMGCVYAFDKYASKDINFVDLVNNKPAYFCFENQKRYDDEYKIYPRYIVFEIRLNIENYQLYVSEVMFDTVDEYSISRQNLADISEFKSFVKEKHNLRI